MTHLTTVHSFVVAAITGRRAERVAPPEDWDDLLGRWDGQRLAAREALGGPPSMKAKAPFPGDEITVGDWVRRMAHESAIHRLDAESALTPVPATMFPAEFAADGVDEYLTFLTPMRTLTATTAGIVHVTATDTGRAWTIRLTPDERPAVGREPEGTPDVVIEGPADDVYRAIWGRPHAAGVTGDTALLAPLAAP